MHQVVFALWFLLPAALANTAPIFAAALPFLKRWNRPMDGGLTYRGQPLFGPHKTWRGLVAGILLGTLVFWLEQIITSHSGYLRDVMGSDFVSRPAWLAGPLFGLGAIGGDALESFFKRRRGVPAGEAWVPFDQLDYIIGTLVVTAPVFRLAALEYLLVIFIGFVLHVVGTVLGWMLRLKERPI